MSALLQSPPGSLALARSTAAPDDGAAIVATLFYTAPPVCRAFGIEVRHRTPILELCRRLVEAGHGAESMTGVNGVTGRPVMNVSSIAEAAELDVVETERGPQAIPPQPGH